MSAEVFVVVTLADNGVVHAWGTGPVTRPGVPFTSRAAARASVRRSQREDAREGHAGRVGYKVLKVLGTEPTDLPPEATS